MVAGWSHNRAVWEKQGEDVASCLFPSYPLSSLCLAHFAGVAMERKRPGALTAIAVLNIVFGSLGLICSCFYSLGVGVLLTVSPNNPNPQLANLGEVADIIKREIPSYLPIEISVALYFVVFSCLLIVAGIGLLYIANWARILCFIFAVTTILTQVAYLLHCFLVIFPAQARIQARFPGGDPVQDRLIQILRIGSIVFIIVYSITLIIVLCQRSIARAFAPPAFGEDYDQSGYDTYEGYDEYHSDRG
jgi:hypothetical protein